MPDRTGGSGENHAIVVIGLWSLVVGRGSFVKLPRPATNDQRPTTNDQRPTTNDQRPTTNDQRPTTNDQRPTTTPCVSMSAWLGKSFTSRASGGGAPRA